MMAKSRERKSNLFSVPPPQLPDDDPYGDVPETTAAQPIARSTTPKSPPASPSKASTPRTPRKSAVVAKPAQEATAQPAGECPPQDPPIKVSAAATVKDEVQVQLYIPDALHTALGEYKAEHWRGSEAPTYAQLSVWACEDHREEVLERAIKIHGLRYGATKDVRGDRTPRGTRKARARVAIGPRYSTGDAQFLQDMVDAAGLVDDKHVRRTTLVAAALAVAVKHPPTLRPEPEPDDEFFG